MSHNPITGDKIATKPSKAYADNYDAIFRRPRLPARPGCQTLQEVVAELSEGDPEFVRLLEEARAKMADGVEFEITPVYFRESERCPMCDVVELKTE